MRSNAVTAEPTHRAVTRGEAAARRRRPSADTVTRFSAIALLVIATAGLAFSDGGFDPVPTSAATAVVLVALLLLATCGPRPLAGMTRWGVVSAGALTCFAVWTLASATWSDAPARALIEYNRTLLYLGAFLLAACLAGGRANARWLIRGTAVALGAAVLAGLLGRLDPGFSAEAAASAGQRLNWPLGYWNALGLAGVLASLACMHLSSDLQERPAVRVVAAAAVPALIVAIYITLSRGSILAGALGAILLLLLARGRGTPATLLAVLPPTAYALAQAYGTEALLDGAVATPPGATGLGETARTIALACLGAGLLRAVGLLLDARLSRARLWRPWSLRRTTAVVAALAGVLLVVGLALDVDSTLARQWEAFTRSQSVAVEDQRDRLRAASANGRIEHWEVALESWRQEPLRGTGAGTYAKTWAQERPLDFAVQDAHSLFFEVLAELGVIGLSLLIIALATPVVAILRRRREDRPLWSAVLVIGLTWALHAGIDWDWEMPALTLPVVALLGAACSRQAAAPEPSHSPGRLPRLLVGLGILLLLLTPIRLGLSQLYLTQSLTAFRAQDCATAAHKALDAAEMLNSRAPAFELLGYCDARLGRYELARRMLKAAQRRDPGSWDLHYGSALVRSVGGRDPRPELRRARRLNPRERALTDALRRMDSDDPRVWVREGRRTPLPLPTP